jgi:hypothetical protein
MVNVQSVHDVSQGIPRPEASDGASRTRRSCSQAHDGAAEVLSHDESPLPSIAISEADTPATVIIDFMSESGDGISSIHSTLLYIAASSVSTPPTIIVIALPRAQ